MMQTVMGSIGRLLFHIAAVKLINKSALDEFSKICAARDLDYAVNDALERVNAFAARFEWHQDRQVYCHGCGDRIPADKANWLNGEPYCEGC